MLMVLAVSIVTLFAALGRCDVWHVGFEGIGVLVVATLLISALPNLWGGYRIAFVVLFVAAPAMTLLWWYRQPDLKSQLFYACPRVNRIAS